MKIEWTIFTQDILHVVGGKVSKHSFNEFIIKIHSADRMHDPKNISNRLHIERVHIHRRDRK